MILQPTYCQGRNAIELGSNKQRTVERVEMVTALSSTTLSLSRLLGSLLMPQKLVCCLGLKVKRSPQTSIIAIYK